MAASAGNVQCCHSLLQKLLDSQKQFIGSEKRSLDLIFFALKFAVVVEMIWLFALSPKNLYIICKLVKVDHAEAWKSHTSNTQGFSHELKTTPLTEYLMSNQPNV